MGILLTINGLCVKKGVINKLITCGFNWEMSKIKIGKEGVFDVEQDYLML